MQGQTTYLTPGFLITLINQRHSIIFPQFPGRVRALRQAAPYSLDLVDAFNRGYRGRREELIEELARCHDVPVTTVRYFAQNLHDYSFLVDLEPTSRFAGDVPGHLAPASSLPVTFMGPLTLVSEAGHFHWFDHQGNKLAILSMAEIIAVSIFAEPTSVQDARRVYMDQQNADGLDESQFDALVSRLAGAGFLSTPPPLKKQDVIPIFRTTELRQVQSLVDARVSAHDESVRRKGDDLMKVVPVNTEKGTAPASLGLLMAYAMEYDGGKLRAKYDFVPMFLTDESRLVERANRPGVFMFSNYVWNIEKNLRLSAAVKRVDPRNITVHGGPSTPSYQKDCEQFFNDNPHVDIAVRGEGELTFAELLSVIDGACQVDLDILQNVEGLTYRTGYGVRRTGNRERIADLNTIPSPYLMGLFDEFGSVSAGAVIETNRGCPYGCTFCDWGSATLSKVRKFDLERVYRELEWSARHQIEGASIADANFGMLERDVAITKQIVKLKRVYGFPRSVAINYAKNQVKYLRQIIEMMADVGLFSEGVVSLQTTDTATLKVIERSNIRLAKYDELSAEFRRAQLPLAADIMMGLPGSTPESFRSDLQKCTDRDIRVRANPTMLLPNSPMNEPNYRKAHGIIARPGELVQETATYTREQWDEMEDLRVGYYMFESFGVLRYIARYVRRETGVREVEFYERLRSITLRNRSEWPLITTAFRYLEGYMAPPGSWGLLIREVHRYLLSCLGIADDSGLRTALQVQLAHLPAPGRVFPDVQRLEHDFASWQAAVFAAREEGHRDDWEQHVPRLAEFGPAEMVLYDPDDICKHDIGKHRFTLDLNFRTWELESPVARPRLGAISGVD